MSKLIIFGFFLLSCLFGCLFVFLITLLLLFLAFLDRMFSIAMGFADVIWTLLIDSLHLLLVLSFLGLLANRLVVHEFFNIAILNSLQPILLLFFPRSHLRLWSCTFLQI